MGPETTLRSSRRCCCPYCGQLLGPGGLVCRDHSDLPNLDPMLRRPKATAKPIGVQPFTRDDAA